MSKNSVHLTSSTRDKSAVVEVDLYTSPDGSLCPGGDTFLTILWEGDETAVVRLSPKQARKLGRALRHAARRVDELRR